MMELVTTMAIIGVLAAIGISITSRTLETQKFESTIAEMKAIKSVIVGSTEIVIGGVRTEFGYIGDMGIMPAALIDLIEQGSQPDLVHDPKYNITYGWGGPYLGKSFEGSTDDIIKDAWDRYYIYSDVRTVNAAGDTILGYLESYGADGAVGGTGIDADIRLDILQSEVESTVYGSAYTFEGIPMIGGTVYLWKPDGTATLSATSITTGVQGTYSFRGIPRGSRALSFKPAGGTVSSITSINVTDNVVAVPRVNDIASLILVEGSVQLAGANNQRVKFKIQNKLGRRVKFVDFQADYPGIYSPTTGPKWNIFVIDGTEHWHEYTWSNKAGSGDRIDSKGSGMSNYILYKNVTINIVMKNFKTNTGSNYDLTGTSFTIIFYSNDSKTYSFDFSV